MRSPEFVEAYDRVLPLYNEQLVDTSSYDGNHLANKWSHTFGKALHDSLSGKQQNDLTLEFFHAYNVWNVPRLVKDVDLFKTPETELEARNINNFHALNRSMAPMWLPLLDGQWPKDHQRSYYLRACRDSLALEGFLGFLSRQEYVEKRGGVHVLQKPNPKHRNKTVTGVLQEFDTAIVVIDSLLKDDRLGKTTTVVPAPLQFERVNRATNANLIVADLAGRRAVGMQVETSARREHIEQSDPRRIVHIDGTMDLGNVMPARIDEGSSKEVLIAWPGIIAAKYMSQIQLTGKKKSPILIDMERRAALQNGGRNSKASRAVYETFARVKALQHEAFSLVGDIKVDFDSLSEIVSDRIREKL